MFDVESRHAAPARSPAGIRVEVCACICRSHPAVVREAVAAASNR